MASPFPGMDPYLEAAPHWPDFQHQFLNCLQEVLQRSLADDYRLRAGTRVYVNQQVLFISVIREEHREEYLEIRQRSSGKLTTWISLISPTNRTTTAGRQEYVKQRDEARKQGAHLVELDLVLQGHTCLDLAATGLPELDYAVSVSRAKRQDRCELYPILLQKRLPRIRLPMTAGEGETVVDLQAVFTRCYDQAFADKVDYKSSPPVLLGDTDARWLDHLLKQQGLR